MKIDWAGGTWSLLAERAAFWHECRWLVVADVHFGKAATFRALGVPVPHGTTHETLQRLSALVERWQPKALVVLGDLFHAREAHAPRTIGQVAAWRARHADLEWILVEGNHDRRAGAPPAELRVTIVDEPWRHAGVTLVHHPRIDAGANVIAGHMHPAIRVAGRGDDAVRVPCFWLREGLMILPAFGAFTGAASIARETGDRVIAVADDRLFDIPALRDAA